MKYSRFFRFTGITCLSLLAIFLLKLIYPQVVFGKVANLSNAPTAINFATPAPLVIPAKPELGQTLIAAATKEDAITEAAKQFVCFQVSQEYPISKFQGLSQSYIESNIVNKLAYRLSSCVNQNRRKIEFVNLDKLYRVIYTTRLLNSRNTAIVIVGVGSSTQIPERAQFSEGIIDLFAANTDKSNPSVTLSNNNINSRSFVLASESFDLKRLGKFVIESKGNIILPSNKLNLNGNEISINTSLNINHELEVDKKSESFNFFKLSFQGRALDFNKDLLSGKREELASAELTFNGLLMKGIPLYFETRKEKLTKDLGIKVKTDNTKNETTLSKNVGVPGYKKLEEIRSIEKQLNDKLYEFRTRQEQIKKDPKNSQIQNKLQASENELKNIMSDKIRLLEALYKVDFQCAPAFIKKVEFPIWGKTTSTGSGNSGASASIGVRGDVVIDIKQPTCSFSIIPPYNSKSAISTDVSVSSNGYFGVKALAQAAGAFNIKFIDKYGEYPIDLRISKLGDDEKRYVSTVLEKTLEDIKNDQNMLDQLQKSIQQEFVDKFSRLPALENEIINRVSSNVEELCKNYLDRLDVDGKLVCWAATATPEEAVEKAEKLADKLPFIPKPDAPNNYIKVATCNEFTRKIPLQDKYCNWLDQVSTWESNIKEKYNIYRQPEKVREIAKEFVNESILIPGKFSPNISKNLARKLLDLAWQAEGGLSKVSDKLDEVLQPAALLKNLKLSIKSSANVEFSSKANILETKPTFKLESTLVFPDGKPALHLTGLSSPYTWQKEPGGNGQVGGLEPLNFNLNAALDAYLEGKPDPLFSWSIVKWKPKFIEQIGVLKYLSNKEKNRLDETIPLSFK